MVTPNASRILDRGWGGTHASSDPNSPYFERMAKSWVGRNNVLPVKYQKENEKHLWRIDSIVYKTFVKKFNDKYSNLIKEQKDLLTKYSIKRDTQLPKLYVTDPIAKYYGCRKGNIVKVLRDSVASTSYLTYRIVV